ncbi:MAG: hypothetical protein A2942_03255 [Candidatus Lloydbacteria bacterium RIFCSPLOWO2_01_FULL_50_20]|uniref:Calcineurin-like phosphoesterase domain-containing protein n=1 Tax=Candidatus Lloydbacteria bacterium RIFCSPLOWO2_01_FULL_50_20 TaxID=1798665 RepID=A0A1G2DIW6_9BACT|nr:MAG: hypothetical protein A3C13_00135 [Candidatus Lloydbacteria bacterium RIFCSPHIGHO2_02_FULL_50_11]OGZ13352.1 MAG: hypothetical protein A2942_03255 [Candidatus Lloydbacteria bacterium RIFCSPLOWO2_01_FULL_50_20]
MGWRLSKPVLLTVVIMVLALGAAKLWPSSRSSAEAAEPIATQANLKVAFIADTGYQSNFVDVLNLIKSEGAEAVFQQGDFDYHDAPDTFFGVIDSVLGPTFPYFASIGNHDDGAWNDGCGDRDGCYATFLKNRMASIGITPDDPNLNDQMYSIDYKGLKVAFVGLDGITNGDTLYAPYLAQQLENDPHVWKVCSWHELQEALQVGGKSDEMGWNVYETCRANGAIIATAHEHSYHRTKTLTNIELQTVDTVQHPLDANGVPGNPDQLLVAAGKTFAFVSGLGGGSIRDQERCFPSTYPYGCNFEWAKIYTTNQGAKYGALFITFNVDGDPNKAVGYFKNVNGEIVDQFTITASNPVPPPTPQCSDTLDNDGDGLIDLADPDCTDASDNDESTPPPPDVTAPTVAVTSPADGSIVARRSTIDITANASDNVGVSRVEFFVDGSLLCSDPATGYSCSWKVPNTRNKVYTLTAQAYDAAGNSGNSAAVTVTAK